MKKDIHSKEYRLVVFEDSAINYSFLTKSTVKTDETVKWEDGNEYPLFKIEISDQSHPYYTGQRTLVDTAGRIEKFNRKYKKKDIPAKQFSDVKIKQRNAGNYGWPGPEKTVKYWVELVNGYAVGMHEPKRGKAEFPMYEMPKEEKIA